MSWCFTDEKTSYTAGVLDALSATHAVVPGLWWYEVLNVLAVNERKRRITKAGADAFLERLSGLDIRIAPVQLLTATAVLDLCRQHRLTAYDAAYLALARQERLSLATFDSSLKQAALLERVNLMQM